MVFKKESRRKSGYRCTCKLCGYYDDIKYKYKLTKKEYFDIYNKQNGGCALCRKNLYPPNRIIKTNIQIDHNHETGEIRGMLCMNCNVNLGWYLKKKDRIEHYAGKK